MADSEAPAKAVQVKLVLLGEFKAVIAVIRQTRLGSRLAVFELLERIYDVEARQSLTAGVLQQLYKCLYGFPFIGRAICNGVLPPVSCCRRHDTRQNMRGAFGVILAVA